MSIPDADAGVETSGNNSVTIECYGIYLAEMTGKSVKTPAFGNTPYLGCRVVASGYYYVALDF